MKAKREELLLENAVEIAAQFYTSAGLDEFRLRVDDSGQVRDIVQRASLQFTEAEIELNIRWDGEWYDSVDSFVAQILATENDFSDERLLDLARESIYENVVHVCDDDCRSNGCKERSK